VAEPIRWEWRAFAALDPATLYAMLAARQQVFVVEQDCAYLDADGRDQQAWHLLGWTRDGALAASLRVLPPGLRFAEHSIGRVLTMPAHRGTGLGRELMQRGLSCVEQNFGPVPVCLAAQAHLRRFYASLGFVEVGEPYDEDGIAHIDMRRS